MSKDVIYTEGQFGEGDVHCTCDSCGDDEVFEFYDGVDFRDVQDYLKDLGWSSQKINGEWLDFCCMECKSAQASSDFQ